METTQRTNLRLFLELMLLGDFETAGFAGLKRRLRTSFASQSPSGWRLRGLARQESFSLKDSVRYRLVLVRRLDHYRLALAECPVGSV